MENKYVAQPGDVLVRNKSALGVVEHLGLFVGNGRVIDNHPSRGVSLISVESFLNGEPLLRIDSYQGSYHSRSLVIQKAYSMLGMKYHLTEFNCEHFVNIAIGAGRKSPQVAVAGRILVLGALVWGLSKVRW